MSDTVIGGERNLGSFYAAKDQLWRQAKLNDWFCEAKRQVRQYNMYISTGGTFRYFSPLIFAANTPWYTPVLQFLPRIRFGESMFHTHTHTRTRYIRNVLHPGKVQLRLLNTMKFAQSGLPRTTSLSETKSSNRKAENIPESTLSHRWETSIPSASQLYQAERFFLSHPPALLYSSTNFRTVELSTVPEVAFLGRSNVGKSSLLNALMGKNLCFTSKKPGRTKTMNFFAVGGEDQTGNPGKVVVLDMPGYGEGSREEWGPEIMKYLIGRRQYDHIFLFVWSLTAKKMERLRRAFLLVDVRHGLKSSDEVLLAELRRNAVSHQIILSKVDKILIPGPKTPSRSRLYENARKLDEIYKNIRAKIQPGRSDGPEALGEIISCSAEKSLGRGRRPGINQIRWAILAATGLNQEKRMLHAIRSMGDRTMPARHFSCVRYIPYQPPKRLVAWANFDLLTFRDKWQASIHRPLITEILREPKNQTMLSEGRQIPTFSRLPSRKSERQLLRKEGALSIQLRTYLARSDFG